MIGLHVEHGADIDLGHAHAGAQQAAACGFQHGEIDLRIGQDHARRDRPGHVALHRALAVDIDAIGGREAGRIAGHLDDVREHARRRRLAVGAGQGRDRHARRRTGREQHVDHRAGDVARLAFAGRHVHAEARRRVHFADAAADALVAFGDVGAEEVHAADVEADGLDRAHGHVAVVRVDDVGDIGRGAAGGQIGGGAQVDHATLFRHRVGVDLGARHHHLGLRIEFEPGQHLFVADAAARILVHDIDQLANAVLAVADDMARRAARGGDEFAVDDEQTMVVAFQIRFDDDRTRDFFRFVETGDHFRFVRQADRDTAAMVAVVGLGDDRIADAARGANGAGFALHQFLARHGQAERTEDLVGLFLVAGQFDRDMRRFSRHRGLDALLVLAVAKLHERLFVQTQPRDVAFFRRFHQRGSGRAERTALRIADEGIARFRPVPVLGHAAFGLEFLRQQRAEQAQGQFAGFDAFFALRIFVHDRIHAGLAVDAARLAEGDVFAGDVLQFDGDVFEHMAQPGAVAFVHAADEAAGLAVGTAMLGQAGQGRDQRGHEIGPEPAGRPGFQGAEVELEADDGEMGVQGRPDEYRSIDNAHAAPFPWQQGINNTATAEGHEQIAG